MWNDFKYGFRSLRRTPGFTLTAIVSIALGIGATSSVFGVADTLLLRPLPVRDASEVVRLRSQTPSGPGGFSYPDFLDLRDQLQSFDDLAAYFLAPAGFSTTPEAQPQLEMGYITSGDFFQVLGVEPLAGRAFLGEENREPGRNPVVVLGHDLWISRFAGDPAVIGARVFLNGLAFEVVGVAPPAFTLDLHVRPAFFAPVMMAAAMDDDFAGLHESRDLRRFAVRGRLADGVRVTAAAAEGDAVVAALAATYPGPNRPSGLIVHTEYEDRQYLNPSDSLMATSLLALVLVVLAIACMNVANLLLARGNSRRRELAVRQAIGGSRGRLVRQLMAESLLIALAGGVLGLLVADAAIAAFSTIRVISDARIELGFAFDQRILIFTAVVAGSSAILFGLAPALRATRTDIVSDLKAGGEAPRRRLWGRSTLVMVQIAGSFALLVAAFHLYAYFGARLDAGPGFNSENRLTMRFDPAIAGHPADAAARFYDALLDRVRETAGVRSVALTSILPLTASFNSETALPEGYAPPAGAESIQLYSSRVSEGYFATMGIPLRAGREFLGADAAGAPLTAVVNQTLADRYFGGAAVGRRIRLEDRDEWVEVVGVAEDSAQAAAFEAPRPILYLPFRQFPMMRMTLVVETLGDPGAMTASIREAASAIDASVPVFSIWTLSDLYYERGVKIARVIAGTVAGLGLIGFGLALIGIYALVSHQVSRRTREIGIRMALGATIPAVLRLVLRHAVILSTSGAVIGFILSYAARDALSLGASAPPGPAVFIVVALTLPLTALAAAAIPARRAAKVDPLRALRQD